MSQQPQPPRCQPPAAQGRGRGQRVAAALAYDPTEGAAPRLVAAGHGLVAERIIAVAEVSGVAVREDGRLAETLAALDLGQTIPIALYAAVAEIIAFLHRRPTIASTAAQPGDAR
ncbi:MAG: EscU/YscU/HrcU family type III secretion system export apparatus switch protein [Rhodospirillales bacterium]|nr:EscU/YscU/HrcU family type III secretion system export apparatus switch protein [Rhodospirillales bacterium]